MPHTAAARTAQPASLRGRQSETIGARGRTGGEPFVADHNDNENSTDTSAVPAPSETTRSVAVSPGR